MSIIIFLYHWRIQDRQILFPIDQFINPWKFPFNFTTSTFPLTHSYGQTHRQTYKQTDTQTDTQTDGQTYRQTYLYYNLKRWDFLFLIGLHLILLVILLAKLGLCNIFMDKNFFFLLVFHSKCSVEHRNSTLTYFLKELL